MRKVAGLFILVFVATTLTACNKPILYSKDREMKPISRSFSTSASYAHEVAKEALLALGYKIAHSDKSGGTLLTGWQSTKPSSHYVDLFDRKDYGTVGAYYRIKIKISDKKNGKANVEISAPIRSVVGRIKSAHREEKKILKKMATLLRREDFEMSNVGITE